MFIFVNLVKCQLNTLDWYLLVWLNKVSSVSKVSITKLCKFQDIVCCGRFNIRLEFLFFHAVRTTNDVAIRHLISSSVCVKAMNTFQLQREQQIANELPVAIEKDRDVYRTTKLTAATITLAPLKDNSVTHSNYYYSSSLLFVNTTNFSSTSGTSLVFCKYIFCCIVSHNIKNPGWHCQLT